MRVIPTTIVLFILTCSGGMYTPIELILSGENLFFFHATPMYNSHFLV